MADNLLNLAAVPAGSVAAVASSSSSTHVMSGHSPRQAGAPAASDANTAITGGPNSGDSSFPAAVAVKHISLHDHGAKLLQGDGAVVSVVLQSDATTHIANATVQSNGVHHAMKPASDELGSSPLAVYPHFLLARLRTVHASCLQSAHTVLLCALAGPSTQR